MPAGSTLQRQIANSTYEDLQRLVFNVTHGFVRQYNIPFSDLISEANMAYVDAVADYDRTRGAQISSWVHTRVWFRLMSHVRKGFKRPEHVSLDADPDTTERVEQRHVLRALDGDNMETFSRARRDGYTSPELFVHDLCDDLSDDACVIVALLTAPRRDFSLLCRMNRTRTQHSMLKTLREYLDDIGWTPEQTAGAFEEIRSALAK